MESASPSIADRADGLDRLVELLGAVAAEDRAAFEELYRLTSAKLFGVCRRILLRPADAEEALQDCYLDLWRKAGTFDAGRGGAIAWLTTLARNRAIDRWRAGAQAREVPALDGAEEIGAAPGGHGDHGLGGELADCLRRLDPRDTAFVTTAFFRGDTYAELARAAGLPLGTVKTRIRRALIKLRECLA